MFPVIMLILQFLWRRFHLWIDQSQRHAIFATSSSTTALCTASCASLPQVTDHDSCKVLPGQLHNPVYGNNLRSEHPYFSHMPLQSLLLSDFGHMELLHKYNPHALFHNTG